MPASTEARTPRPLFLGMAVQFAVGGAVIPFVSMLLRDRGLDYAQISRVFFAACCTLLVFPFFWGMLADRFVPLNRLFALINCLALGALVIFSSHRSYPWMLASFAVFFACFNPTMTLMNALCFHHMRDPRAQFAWVRAWGSLGWIVPSLPVFFLLLANPGAGLEFTALLGLGFSAAMVAISFVLPSTPPGARKKGDEAQGQAYWPAVRRLVLDLNYAAILVSFFLITASFSVLTFYSAPFLEDLGMKRAWIGPIQCTGAAVEVVLFPLLPRVISRWNYAAAILFGAACLSVRHLLFFLSDNLALLAVSYVLAGMVIVFFHSGISILANSIAPKEVRATAQTLLAFAGSGLGPMFANWMAGIIAARGGGLRPVFLFASGLAALASLVILSRFRKLNAAPPAP